MNLCICLLKCQVQAQQEPEGAHAHIASNKESTICESKGKHALLTWHFFSGPCLSLQVLKWGMQKYDEDVAEIRRLTDFLHKKFRRQVFHKRHVTGFQFTLQELQRRVSRHMGRDLSEPLPLDR